MEDRAFLIDICGTMFRSNTTFDFIKYYYGSNWHVKFLFSLPYRIYNRLMFRFFKKEPLRRNLIKKLRGKTYEQLTLMAKDFCRNFLFIKENAQVINLINKKRAEGCRLVIASATLDVIANSVALYYNIPECFSTTLEYDSNGACTGRISKDLLSCKKVKLKAVGIVPPYVGILTDNFSDSDIICESSEAYLVTYKMKKSKWLEIPFINKLKSCRVVEFIEV